LFPQQINYSNNRSPKACAILWVLLAFSKIIITHCIKKYSIHIQAAMKVETDIIANITASLIGQALILVKKSVETLKTDVIVVIGNIDITLTDNFRSQSVC
jgi:glycine betaine/choline ABC-type transport system substrate-binding protein